MVNFACKLSGFLLLTAAVALSQTAQPTPKPDLRSTQKPADSKKVDQGKSTPPANPAPAVPAAGQDRPAPRFDIADIDKTVDPCVDFYQYACGNG